MENMLELRAAWVAKGRPADLADPYWASVVAAQAAPRPTWVEPLVTLVHDCQGGPCHCGA